MRTKKIKNMQLALLPLFVAVCIFVPSFASAHQPRIVQARPVSVPDPEISKAYYAKLAGEPDVYVIQEKNAFDLYVEVLVPDIVGQKKDVSAVVLKDGKQIAILDGSTFTWKKFFEEFGHDTYWQGPEYKAHVEAGTYEIRVWSSNNDSKYSLAIGETEKFDLKEGLNALTLIPQIKKNFFNKVPVDFIFSPFGWGLIVVLYLFAAVVGFVYRRILRKIQGNHLTDVSKNIGKSDRLLRVAIGVVLLLLAITTNWSFILIFFSGFAFFEAIVSWCGFYALLDKNTCTIN